MSGSANQMTIKDAGEATDDSPEPDHSLPDSYLQELVRSVNGTDGSLTVVLFVGGLVISGHLVSAHLYFEAVGKQIATILGVADDAELIGQFAGPGERYKRKSPEDLGPRTAYIHLRDAKVFAPGQAPMPQNGSWWRGRLSSVDGYSFGSLGGKSPDR